MEMEKSYYLVTGRPAYAELLQAQAREAEVAASDEPVGHRLIVAITQGGFGQDIVDDERQAKERFLEYLFFTSGIDLPRSAEAFDEYFEMEAIADFVDLDEEM